MGVEGRLEDELRQMKLELLKKEDKITGVSAEFEKVKDSLEKLKDLKISFKRFENTFGSNFGILSHDLDNLKNAFTLLKMTSFSTSKSKNNKATETTTKETVKMERKESQKTNTNQGIPKKNIFEFQNRITELESKLSLQINELEKDLEFISNESKTWHYQMNRIHSDMNNKCRFGN